MGLVLDHGSVCWAGSDIWWEHRWAASSPHKASSVKWSACRSFCKRPSISKSSKSKSQSLQKPVMKETSSDFLSAWFHTHLAVFGAKLSRSLQGQEMTLNKNSLGSLSQRRGNKAVGVIHSKWQLQNPSSHFCSNLKPMCKTGTEQTVRFQRQLPKNFTWKPKRFSVPFTSPLNLRRKSLNWSTEPTVGLRCVKTTQGLVRKGKLCSPKFPMTQWLTGCGQSSMVAWAPSCCLPIHSITPLLPSPQSRTTLGRLYAFVPLCTGEWYWRSNLEPEC